MAETQQYGMEYSDWRKILAAVRSLGACLAAGGSDESIRDRRVLLEFLDGDQEPSQQTVPKGRHFVGQTTKDIFVSFAAVDLCLKNFGSREHKNLLTLREVWILPWAACCSTGRKQRPAPRIPQTRSSTANGVPRHTGFAHLPVKG